MFFCTNNFSYLQFTLAESWLSEYNIFISPIVPSFQ
jgi:hypothetical protein